MSSASPFCHQPTCNIVPFHPFNLSNNTNISRKSVLSFRFRSSKSNLFGGFLSKKRGRVSMSGFIKASAFRNGGNGEERFQALEQEAFVDGLTEIRHEMVASGGIEATLNRLSKWVISALFGSIIVLRHDGGALWASIGVVANAMLSTALKRLLNQERPVAGLRSDPGMPSSHAQSISYIVVFAVLTIVEWLGINELSLFICGLILACGSYFTWLRVSQKLHTISQVAVGAILGSVFSILWYTTWNAVVLEAFVSSLWVQVFVFLGAVAFGLGFLVYVAGNWLTDER